MTSRLTTTQKHYANKVAAQAIQHNYMPLVDTFNQAVVDAAAEVDCILSTAEHEAAVSRAVALFLGEYIRNKKLFDHVDEIQRSLKTGIIG